MLQVSFVQYCCSCLFGPVLVSASNSDISMNLLGCLNEWVSTYYHVETSSIRHGLLGSHVKTPSDICRADIHLEQHFISTWNCCVK